VRISKVEYIFADKNFKFEFNSNSEEDNNTYSLILGNNGSGKSTFFEVLLGKFSDEYEQKEPSSVELEEGSLKKIILSTYSPFDRISNKTLRESSRVFFKIKTKKNEKKVEEGTDQKNTEVIYPIHTHDKIVSLACSSYYKCIIKNDRHFDSVEKAVSDLLELDSSNKLFLIESINQAKIRNIFKDAISSYNNDVFRKVHERISYTEQSEQILLKSFWELMYKRNELFEEIYRLFDVEKRTEELQKLVINFFNTEFIPRFADDKTKTEDYYEITSQSFLKFITSGKYFNYRFYLYEDVLQRVKNLADIREKMFKTLDELNELENKGKSYFTYHNLNNYFLKFEQPESFNIFLVLVYLKELYKNIKSNHGKEVKYDDYYKKLLSVNDIEKFYQSNFKEDYKTLMNLDFDILEKTDNFLIDDLVILKSNRYTSISQLSSGEFSIFLRIMEISLYIENDSLILIDEPEIHLNPKWINQYYYILRKCFSNLNCHFIIASQSPLIVGMFSKDQIFYIDLNNVGNSVRRVKEETFAGSIDSILKYIFNVDYSDNQFIQQEVRNIERLSKTNLLGAIDKIDKIAYGTIQNKLLDHILTEENISRYEEIIEKGGEHE
jgi:hypothetical protein